MQKKKTAIVTARMTPKVKQQLQQRAQDANMTLTDYLCICGLGREIVRVDGLDDILSELKAQGRNSISSPRWPTWERSLSCGAMS